MVAQLEGAAEGESRLLDYLHAVFLADVHLCAAFHGMQLGLYGKHAPHQLMPFLKGSPHYPLELALETCREHGLVAEQVYVLGRMGAHREALALMLAELEDIEGAVEFVRASREGELWKTLLSHALSSPSLAAKLLEHVSKEPLRTLDTLTLVRELPDGIDTATLPRHLAGLIKQAGAQLELTRASLDVAHADRVALLRERHRLMQAPLTTTTTGGGGGGGGDSARPAAAMRKPTAPVPDDLLDFLSAGSST